MFEYCDIKIWLFIPCEKEMNVKCCLLNLNIKYPTLTFITPCLNIKQVILTWSGAHMIDDVALNMKAIGPDIKLSLCTLPGML